MQEGAHGSSRRWSDKRNSVGGVSTFQTGLALGPLVPHRLDRRKEPQMRKSVLVLAILALASGGQAASFDCTKASSLAEKVICSDRELSDLDDSLSLSYRNALANFDDASEIKVSQRNWLRKRNLCKDKACLKQAYVQRLNELITFAPSALPRSDKAHLPKKVGDCIESFITKKSTRFEGSVPGEPGGEVVVSLENGISLYVLTVYEIPSSVNTDKYMYSTPDFVKGDKIKLCLVSLPKNCPPGDERGKTYSVFNYRSKRGFTGVDSWHSCGGA
jgi:uncharacterized protein YecT (DUF1311 family)